MADNRSGRSFGEIKVEHPMFNHCIRGHQLRDTGVHREQSPIGHETVSYFNMISGDERPRKCGRDCTEGYFRG
jgi:hypothetical protein